MENLAAPDANIDHVSPLTDVSAVGAVELSANTRDRLRRAMPESTRRAYTGDLSRFLTWCADRNLLPAAGEPTADERLADAIRQLLERHGDLHVIITEYVSALADAGRAPATIERARRVATSTMYDPAVSGTGREKRRHRQ